MSSFNILPALAAACVSALIAIVLRDIDRRLGTLERKVESIDRFAAVVAELTAEVRMLKERLIEMRHAAE
jgi:hypothetical protein